MSVGMEGMRWVGVASVNFAMLANPERERKLRSSLARDIFCPLRIRRGLAAGVRGQTEVIMLHVLRSSLWVPSLHDRHF
jgi:hypothetical protein